MFANVTLSLMGGFVTTVQLFCLTLVFALPLGLLISFGSMSGCIPLRALIKIILCGSSSRHAAYAQIIIIFYGSGSAVVGTPPLLHRCAGGVRHQLRLLFFSEIFRGGIQSIPSGQYEAGQVLGMTKSQIFFKGNAAAGHQARYPADGQRVYQPC